MGDSGPHPAPTPWDIKQELQRNPLVSIIRLCLILNHDVRLHLIFLKVQPGLTGTKKMCSEGGCAGCLHCLIGSSS